MCVCVCVCVPWLSWLALVTGLTLVVAFLVVALGVVLTDLQAPVCIAKAVKGGISISTSPFESTCVCRSGCRRRSGCSYVGRGQGQDASKDSEGRVDYEEIKLMLLRLKRERSFPINKPGLCLYGGELAS